MSLNSTYHKITGYATLMVLLWNIVGWLGFGLVLNHSHDHNEKNHCEVTFCYCETEEGETICTCHHNSMNEHSGDSGNEFCYYTSSHSDADTASQALIVIAKFNALYLNSQKSELPINSREFQFERGKNELSGAIPDLLRPPRV